MDFIAYFLAVRKHWWALMSSALFTFLGIWIDYADKNNAWSIRAAFTLALFCLLVACYKAWHDEYEQVAVLKAENEKLERKHSDDRPRLSVETHSVEGPRQWKEHPAPVTFSLQHLSGRVPTTIRFDPIPSLLGKFSLQFETISHAEKHPKGLHYIIEEVGVVPLSANDLETIGNIERDMLLQFLDDSPPQSIDLTYTLLAHFRDAEEDCSQSFRLTFDRGRYRFLASTAL